MLAHKPLSACQIHFAEEEVSDLMGRWHTYAYVNRTVNSIWLLVQLKAYSSVSLCVKSYGTPVNLFKITF